jgi:hypothetical protein
VGNVIVQVICITDKECVRLPWRLCSAYSHYHLRLVKTGKNNHKEHVEVYYFVATIYKNVLVISNWEVMRSSRRFLRQATQPPAPQDDRGRKIISGLRKTVLICTRNDSLGSIMTGGFSCLVGRGFYLYT